MKERGQQHKPNAGCRKDRQMQAEGKTDRQMQAAGKTDNFKLQERQTNAKVSKSGEMDNNTSLNE